MTWVNLLHWDKFFKCFFVNYYNSNLILAHIKSASKKIILIISSIMNNWYILFGGKLNSVNGLSCCKYEIQRTFQNKEKKKIWTLNSLFIRTDMDNINRTHPLHFGGFPTVFFLLFFVTQAFFPTVFFTRKTIVVY